MSKMAKRVVAALICVIMLAALFAGCNGSSSTNGEKTTEASQSTASSSEVSSLEKDPYEGYTDATDVPTWTGNQLELVKWYAGGTGSANKVFASNDVVTPEIKRMIGVQYNKDLSFDNGGQDTYDAKMAKIVATGDFPDVVEGIPDNAYQQLVERGLLYDLTDLIPKYAPNYWKTIQNPGFAMDLAKTKINDKMYSILVGGWQYVNTFLMDRKNFPNDIKYSQATGGETPECGFIYVRDDILKMIYPNAYTEEGLREFVASKGGNLTREDFFDVPINSKDDFFNFLRAIKKLNLKEDGKPVEAAWTHAGSDNWIIGTILAGQLLGFNNHMGLDNNYFTFWDKKNQKVDFMFAQQWYKDYMLEVNKLVREGVFSPDSILENDAQFKAKLNNGLYATSFGWYGVDNSALTQAGKKFQYRKVYLNIKPDYDNFVQPNNATGMSMLGIFTNKVKKEDLPQILRFFDVAYTKVGQNLRLWGPRSAGLFREINGLRMYTDADITNAYYGQPSQETGWKVYNLSGRGGSAPRCFPGYPFFMGNELATQDAYPVNVTKDNAMQYYWLGNVAPLKKVTCASWFIVDYSADVPEVQKFWSARNSFEDAMKKCFAAKDDAQFDKLYNEALTLAQQNGLTADALTKIDTIFKDKNKAIMDQLTK